MGEQEHATPLSFPLCHSPKIFCFLFRLLNYTYLNLHFHPLVSPLLVCPVHPWPEVCGYKDGAISSCLQVHLLFHWLGFMVQEQLQDAITRLMYR